MTCRRRKLIKRTSYRCIAAHVPAIKASSDIIDFKAVYSRSSRTATSFSLDKQVADYKLDVYHGDDGLEELLKRDDIHAVIIALPIPKQPEIVEKALRAGKHVLSEKPIGPDVASAKKLVEMYESEFKNKGQNLEWRVAENFAHEPAVLRAAELVGSGESPLGPVLYYDVKVVNNVKSGSKYHATEWRNVPQYQGGFLMDGGVHSVAALRVILGSAKPTHLVGQSSLHRTHLGPHDTIFAITSLPSSTVPPHGDPNFPQPENLEMGKSTPSGTFLMSFSAPRTPEGTPQVYTITCLNAVLKVTMGSKWTVEVLSEDPSVVSFAGAAGQKGGESFDSVGVKEEVRQFAEKVLGKSKDGEVKNNGEPRGALWDVEFVQAALRSGGKEVVLADQ